MEFVWNIWYGESNWYCGFILSLVVKLQRSVISERVVIKCQTGVSGGDASISLPRLCYGSGSNQRPAQLNIWSSPIWPLTKRSQIEQRQREYPQLLLEEGNCKWWAWPLTTGQSCRGSDLRKRIQKAAALESTQTPLSPKFFSALGLTMLPCAIKDPHFFSFTVSHDSLQLSLCDFAW